MEIKIFWRNKESEILLKKVEFAIEELWLSDFIQISITTDETLKKELSIKKEPALIVIEETIDFKDTIFEWIVPEDEEIKSMLISIIWWNDNKSCDTANCWISCSC